MKQSLWAHFRRTLINGLLLLVPVALTYVIVRFLFDAVDGLLRPAMSWAFAQFGVNWSLPGPGLLAAVLLIYLVGLVTAFGLGRWVVERTRALLLRVPFIGAIYSTNHRLVESFSGAGTTGFQRVVLVEFPRPSSWSLGFLTGLSDTEGVDKLIMAYVPTAPFPNSGFVIFLPAECVLDTDLTVPQAMKLVFSGGVVSPAGIKTRKIDIDELERDFQRSQPPDHSLADTVKEKIRATASGASRATRSSAQKLGRTSPTLVKSAVKEQRGSAWISVTGGPPEALAPSEPAQDLGAINGNASFGTADEKGEGRGTTHEDRLRALEEAVNRLLERRRRNTDSQEVPEAHAG